MKFRKGTKKISWQVEFVLRRLNYMCVVQNPVKLNSDTWEDTELNEDTCTIYATEWNEGIMLMSAQKNITEWNDKVKQYQAEVMLQNSSKGSQIINQLFVEGN